MKTGLEVLVAHPPEGARSQKLGLLCNQASIGPGYRPAWELVDEACPGRLQALFGPQHGLWGEKQDNMVASPDFTEPTRGIPVYSLYGERFAPTPEMLRPLDALLIDLPDVGTRVYTFATTMAYAMAAAGQAGTRVVILDRPNPIGGVQVEGNLLIPALTSLVGPYPLPMRHGLTLGELARYFNQTFGLGCELTVIPAEGWRRGQYGDETGLPWVMPSPNLPTLDTALVYPGQVLWEGTNISEGRGTTRPFELWGAPFINPAAVKAKVAREELPGVILRPTWFQPTFHKWAGEVCGGLQLHVTDRRSFKPYLTTLTLLAAVRELYPEECHWRTEPYEYETERLAFDLLAGDTAIRAGLEAGIAPRDLEAFWQRRLAEFLEVRRQFLLYPD